MRSWILHCLRLLRTGPSSLQPDIQKNTSQSGEAFLFAVDAADAEILIQEKSGGLKVWDHLHDTDILTQRNAIFPVTATERLSDSWTMALEASSLPE
jgi:hypothetical protein